MSAFLIDEMFPPVVAGLLRDNYGHDAVHVIEIGLRAVEDAQVAAVARSEGRAVVTENVADFAAERDLVLVFVLKRNLPTGGAQATALAKALDNWAHANPDPTSAPTGHHWADVRSFGRLHTVGQAGRSVGRHPGGQAQLGADQP